MNPGSLVAMGVGITLIPMGAFVMLRPERVRSWERSHYAHSGLSFRLVLIDRPGYVWFLRFAGAFVMLFGGLALLVGVVAATR
jgi:hypothetical protein